VLKPEDELILSKGHAAGALYVALWSAGRLSEQDLQSFHRDNTLLSGHPPVQGIPEILFPTGSLGHGRMVCKGLAAPLRLQISSRLLQSLSCLV
jgi:transketolase